MNSAPKNLFWLSPDVSKRPLYETLSGNIPFNLNSQNESAEVVVAIVHTLGKLPKACLKLGLIKYGHVTLGESYEKAAMRSRRIL